MDKFTALAKDKDGYRPRMEAAYRYGLELLANSQQVKITVEPYKPNRSLAQNKLYWKWINQIAEHLNEALGQQGSAEEWHEVIAEKLLPMKFNKITGKPRRASTSKLTTKQFTSYLETLEHYIGLHYPDLQLVKPEDLYYLSMGGRK